MKDDLISRQDAIDKAILIPIAKIVTEDKVIYRRVIFIEDIESLPSAERKGKWIAGNSVGCVQCDGCNKNYDWDSQAQYYNFCPNCGADMRGEEDDT